MANQETYELNNSQRLFLRYTIAVLVALTVLNLFEEYWDRVEIGSFTISLATAFLLQLLLVITIKFEHRVIHYFKGKSGVAPRIYRGLSVWLILLGSKFAMLGAIDLVFGERVKFSGPFHGVVAFVVVVITMILAEESMRKIYFALDDKEKLPVT